MKDEARAEHPGHAGTKPPAYQPDDNTGGKAPQFAMVPEWILELPLNHTDLKVFIALSAKASGRERIAWISQAAVAERIGMRRETVGRSIRRLIKHDVVQVKGRVVVNYEQGTWVRRYLVAPYPGTAEQPVETPSVTSGLPVPDTDVRLALPDVTSTQPDERFGGPDVTQLAHTFRSSGSDPLFQTPNSERVSVEEEEPKTEGQELAEEERCPRCPDCLPSWHRMWHREHAGMGEA